MRLPLSAPTLVKLPERLGSRLALYWLGTWPAAAAVYFAAENCGLFWMARRCASARVRRMVCWACAAPNATRARRIENRILVGPVINQRVSGGNQENGEGHGHAETAENGARQGRVGLTAGAELQRHGKQSDDGGERRHEHGTQADAASHRDGVAHVHSIGAEVARELHDQDAVGDGDADEHDDAHQRHDVEGGAGEVQSDDNPGQPGRHGGEDDEGIEEGLELGHQNEVEQHHREDQTQGKAAEGIAHALHHAAQVYVQTLGLLGIGDDAVDGVGDFAEILIERADIDIGSAAQRVVIHFSGRLNAGDVANGVEAGGCRSAGPTQGDGAQIVQVLHLALGILRGQHIVVAALGIDPVAGRDHTVGGEGGDDVIHYFALIQPQFAGSGAVDIEAQRGVVDVLRSVDVSHAGNFANPRGKFDREIVRFLHVQAIHLNVDGRGHTHIQHRIHQAARLEVGGKFGKILGQLLFDAGHVVVAAGLVILLQTDLYEGGVHGRVGGVDGGEIGCGTDVGDDHPEVLRGDDLADEIFHFGDSILRNAEARAGGSLQVDDELAGVRAGEEGETQLGEQHEARGTEKAEARQGETGGAQGGPDQHVVDLEEALEAVVEPDIEAVAEGLLFDNMVDRDGLLVGRRSMVRRNPDEAGAEQRDHGEGHSKGREQRERHG